MSEDPTRSRAATEDVEIPQVEKLIIEIPRPIAEDGNLTERWNWYQGMAEAMIAGGRIYCQAAHMVASPTLHLDAEVVPKDWAKEASTNDNA